MAWMRHGMGVGVCSSSPEAVCKVAGRNLAIYAGMYQTRRAKARYAAMQISHCLAWFGLEGYCRYSLVVDCR